MRQAGNGIKPNQKIMTHQQKSDQTRYVVRLAETAAELHAILKVRYEVLRVDFSMYTPENSAGTDIDQWDTQACHLGLWKLTHGQETPIGYMRIIQTNPVPVGKEVLKIVKAFPSLENQSRRTSKNPIRFLEIFQGCEEARIKYDGLVSEKIMEGSRLAVKREYRDLYLGRFLVECSFALFYGDDRFHHGFIEVRENHFPAYYRYGFRQVVSKYVPEDGGSHILCYAHYSDLPGPVNGKLSAMREEFDRYGEIVFRPNTGKTKIL